MTITAGSRRIADIAEILGSSSILSNYGQHHTQSNLRKATIHRRFWFQSELIEQFPRVADGNGVGDSTEDNR